MNKIVVLKSFIYNCLIQYYIVHAFAYKEAQTNNKKKIRFISNKLPQNAHKDYSSWSTFATDVEIDLKTSHYLLLDVILINTINITLPSALLFKFEKLFVNISD